MTILWSVCGKCIQIYFHLSRFLLASEDDDMFEIEK